MLLGDDPPPALVDEVSCELHVFDRSPHGLGRDLRHPWSAVCAHWLAGLFRERG